MTCADGTDAVKDLIVVWWCSGASFDVCGTHKCSIRCENTVHPGCSYGTVDVETVCCIDVSALVSDTGETVDCCIEGPL